VQFLPDVNPASKKLQLRRRDFSFVPFSTGFTTLYDSSRSSISYPWRARDTAAPGKSTSLGELRSYGAVPRTEMLAAAAAPSSTTLAAAMVPISTPATKMGITTMELSHLRPGSSSRVAMRRSRSNNNKSRSLKLQEMEKLELACTLPHCKSPD